jgi:hypothetical protein
MFSFLAGGVREKQATPFLPIPLNPNSNKVRRVEGTRRSKNCPRTEKLGLTNFTTQWPILLHAADE